MGLRGNHRIGDPRQEHVDNHNLIEPFVRDFDPSAGTAATPVLRGIPDVYSYASAGDYLFFINDAMDGYNIWQATATPTGNPPAPEWSLVGPTAAGVVWSAEATYASGALVLYVTPSSAYTLYRALRGSTAADPPSSPSDWVLVAGEAPDPERLVRTLLVKANHSLSTDYFVRRITQTVAEAHRDGVWQSFTLAVIAPIVVQMHAFGPQGTAPVATSVASISATRVTDSTGVLAAPGAVATVDIVSPPLATLDGYGTVLFDHHIDEANMVALAAEAPNESLWRGMTINGDDTARGLYVVTVLFSWAS